MKLRDLLSDQREIKREVLIGREIDVQDKKALLLGLREIEDMDDGELISVSKLLVLHEDCMEDDEVWDEDEDWDDEEEQTNRQVLIETMDTEGDISVTDIDAFHINGKDFETEGIQASYLEEQPYEEIMLIKHYAEKGCISEQWMEKDVDMLALTEYDVAPEMFEISWDADILNITAEMMEPPTEVLVGKVIRCEFGHYDSPKEFTIKGKNGEAITVRIHGMFLHDIWSDIACLDLDFSELEEYCDRDERMLVVEYSTDENLQIEFFTKEYLDAPADYEEHISDICLSGGVFSDADGRELRAVDVVPKDFNDDVEIELLSYTLV